MKHNNPVVHFEMPAKDRKRVADFYSKVFGEPMDIPGIGKYISFKDTESNLVGMLQPS